MLVAVLIATAINLIVDAVIVTLGGRPGYLLDLSKRFQDFYSFGLSFPLSGPIVPAAIDAGSVNAAAAIAQGVDAPGLGLTNLHVPPLAALFGLAAGAGMRIADPSFLFFGLLLVLAIWWIVLVRQYAPVPERAALIALGLVAYPAVLMATRGNLHAGITALLLVQAMLLSVRGKAPLLTGALLALAVCNRPNAILFAAPMLLLQPRWLSAGAALAVTGTVASVAAYFIVHAIYPAYTVNAVLDALQLYHQRYVVENAGLGFGSSLMGGLKLVYFGYHPALEVAGTLTGLGIVAAAVVLHLLRPLSPAILLFLTLAGYTLGSAVIGDYHLMAFLVISLVVARGRLDRSSVVALLATTAMLLPKSIYLRNHVTTQVGLNPLILLIAVLFVLFVEARARWRPGAERFARRGDALA